MRRYVPLLFVITSILLLILAGNMFWIYHTSNNQQINITKNKIVVYTTLPTQIAAPMAAEYEKLNKVKVNFVLLSEKELMEKISSQSSSFSGQVDVILADKGSLQKAAEAKILTAFTSEQQDLISSELKDKDNLWTGVWYDPIVFCVNRDYVQNTANIPHTWVQLATDNNIRIGLTDFLASDTSANLFYALIEQYGQAQAFSLLNNLHPKVMQYAKYLSTPVRMAGMGEVDLSIAVQSEAIKYLANNYPLLIIYPQDGTYYEVTGVGLLQNAPNKVQAVQFIQWLLGDDLQLCLQSNGFFFIPTNYSTIAYKRYAGKSVISFTKSNYTELTDKEKSSLLDNWVKNIRLQ